MGRVPGLSSILIRVALLGLTGLATGCGGHGHTRVAYQGDPGDFSDAGGGCDCSDPGVVYVDDGSGDQAPPDDSSYQDGSQDDGSGDSPPSDDSYEDDSDDYSDQAY